MYEYLKNDPNFGKNKQNNNSNNNSELNNDTNSNNNSQDNNDNKNENDINNNIPNKEEEKKSNIKDIIDKEEKEENNKKNPNEEDNKENPDNKDTNNNLMDIKINKKKKHKKKEKSLISDGQKPENYSKDSSMISGVLKGKIDDKISNISKEKKSEKEKSLISENSKQKKLDLNNDNNENEEEISMGNISKINHLLADESKNDEEILNEIDNNNDNNNKNNTQEKQENNTDINLNINEVINKKEENKETNELKLDDIKDEESLDLSKENKKEKKKDKIIDLKKNKTDSSYISKFSHLNKAKEEGFYDNDSNIFKDNDSSHISKDIYDLISESSSNKANPPKSKNNLNVIRDDNQKENEIIESIPKKVSVISVQGSKMYMKSSSEQIKKNNEDLDEIKEEKDENNKEAKKVNVNTILNTNEEIMPFSEFTENHKNFTSIYLADLKKHHIIYFSFCHSKDDINNIYLKLSLFSISIILYFSLNTIFMINSKMANVYFDFGSSSPIYILINLILPYIICGIIILLLKRYILYNHYVTKIIKTIQEDKELRRIVGIDKVQEQISKYKDIPKKNKKRIIKNIRNQGVETLDVKIQNEYQNQKDIIQSKLLPIYPKYKKIIAIYFLVGFIFLGINWYMMTSFCAIYKNTGIKLIVNSFVSLLASFIFPCIFGLIPTLIGFLSKKLNNRVLYKIYKTINKVI